MENGMRHMLYFPMQLKLLFKVREEYTTEAQRTRRKTQRKDLALAETARANIFPSLCETSVLSVPLW
jgi:hypothetical protein